MAILLRLLSEQPMPPDDSDFGLKIDFQKGVGDPRRIFDAASALIDAFEILDHALVASVDSKIEPVMVLENVEASSLKIWLRTFLNCVDDDALKGLEWKKQIGKYLVKAKYLALEFLDDKSATRPSLEDLTGSLRTAARN